MGDNDLIRRGDAMMAAITLGDERIADEIRALPAVTQPAPDAAMRLETVSENIARDMREGRFPARSEPQMAPTEPAPDADDSYPYDATEQCERDLDGAEDEPVVNEKLRTMHREYLQAIAEGRLVTDAVSPTDARLAQKASRRSVKGVGPDTDISGRPLTPEEIAKRAEIEARWARDDARLRAAVAQLDAQPAPAPDVAGLVARLPRFVPPQAAVAGVPFREAVWLDDLRAALAAMEGK